MRKIRAQSIVEYALLLGVSILAIFMMQVFLKRSFQGSLKESSDRISSEGFSVSSTSTHMLVNSSGQNIIEETATSTSGLSSNLIQDMMPAATIHNTLNFGTLTATIREGGSQNVTTETRTGSVSREVFNMNDLPENNAADFTITGLTL